MIRRAALTGLVVFMMIFSVAAYAQVGLQDGDATLSTDNATDANATDANTASAAGESAKVEPQLVLAAPDVAPVGVPFAVRLTSTAPLEEVVVYWEGKEVMPSISVWNNKHVAVALLGTDVLNEKPGNRELVITASVDGKRRTFKKNMVIKAKKYPRQDLTLPKNMVTPPKTVYDRIAKERKVIATARDTISPKRFWHLPLLRPVDGDVSSVYGMQRFLNKKPKNPHRGMDFRAAKGTPIKCVADGKVILQGNHYYAGNSVYVDHGNGMVSMYFHMSEFKVKEGDTVKRGQVLGLAGSTGRATGPHLHLSIGLMGKLVDPAPLFMENIDQLLQ